MTTIFKSDVFRYFLGGFALGAVVLFAMQPDENRDGISTKMTGAYSVIESQIRG